ncbi:hypothetical protein RS022_00810 [Candidatus Phytoplasma rubi]|uniref:Uncharacterized protein n=1 Tax=Candidatus Phytoplasma rubi TaxID=399025 RepID=A0ABY7BSE8_9MOLU|nr:hypothetical protein [Candidatus Phytoplasma rubi]WAN63091.1 hypothetical protein RS022_00810 [Candidatus Phytoplasma rubi]
MFSVASKDYKTQARKRTAEVQDYKDKIKQLKNQIKEKNNYN